MARVIGIDLGGTSLRAGLIQDRSGQVQQWTVRDSPIAESSPQLLLDAIYEIATAVSKRSDIALGDLDGIGVAVPAPVDPATGDLATFSLVPDHACYPLTRRLLEHLAPVAVPLIVENDANCAALAEYHACLARGQRSEHFVYLTISSGVGAGIILRGRLYTGANGNAGEFGHLIVDPGGPVDPACGQPGCLEILASGSAIARQGAVLADRRESKLYAIVRHRHDAARTTTSSDAKTDSGYPVSARDVTTASREGDPQAQAILSRAAHYLAIGVAQILYSLNPDHLMIGGGVIQGQTGIWELAQREWQKLILPTVLNACVIEHSPLHGQNATLGAAYLALDMAHQV